MRKSIRVFMILFFPAVLRKYYKVKYRDDILKLLNFLAEYEGGSDIGTMAHVMRLDHDWTVDKFVRILGVCVYLGFVSGASPARSIYQKLHLTT